MVGQGGVQDPGQQQSRSLLDWKLHGGLCGSVRGKHDLVRYCAGAGGSGAKHGDPVSATEELRVCSAGSAFRGLESSGMLFSDLEAQNAC